jgi:hypothetical protein
MCLMMLAGCSQNQLNSPQAARDFSAWATEYGCTNPAAGEGVAAATDRRLRRGPLYQPQVGWDACELMFALGYPNKEESQETEDGRYRSWWYHEYDEVHLVGLTFRPEQSTADRSAWVVTYVGW